jgi:hypothetical protein
MLYKEQDNISNVPNAPQNIFSEKGIFLMKRRHCDGVATIRGNVIDLREKVPIGMTLL